MRQFFKPLDKSGYKALVTSFAAGLYLSAFYILNNLTMLRGAGILFILSIMTIPLLILTIAIYYPLQLARKGDHAQTIVVFIVSAFLLFVLRPTLLDFDFIKGFFGYFPADQKTFAYILYIVIPSTIITVFFRKNILIYAVMLGTMTIAAVLMNFTKITADSVAPSYGKPQLHLESLRLNERPNIYFILADGYGSLAYMKEHGVDVSDFTEYLSEAKFRLYEDTYSNYQPTTSAMPAILNMEHHYYSLTEEGVNFSEVNTAARVIIGGNNYVSHILRDNGYSIQYIHGGTYLLLQGCSADVCFPKIDGMAGARIILSHIFETDLLADKDRIWATTTNAQLREQAVTLMEDATNLPRFQYIHTFKPGHSRVYPVGKKCDEKFEFARYVKNVRIVGEYLRNHVDDIIKRDPGAVIMVAGDHGPFISNGCSRYAYINDVSDYRDRAGALIAIRWPKSYDGNYDERIVSGVNLFRYVLASLAIDERAYLQSTEPDDVFVRAGDKVFKVIDDGEPLSPPEEYIKNHGKNSFSRPAVPCDDSSRGSEIQQGLCFYNYGESQFALQKFLKALKQNPGSAVALNNICAAHNSLGQFEEGIQACEKALELRPNYNRARNNLAWAKRKMKAAKGRTEKQDATSG